MAPAFSRVDEAGGEAACRAFAASPACGCAFLARLGRTARLRCLRLGHPLYQNKTLSRHALEDCHGRLERGFVAGAAFGIRRFVNLLWSAYGGITNGGGHVEGIFLAGGIHESLLAL